MTIQRLSKLVDWRVKYADQDIRGSVVSTPTDPSVGTIVDMVVDTDTRLVTSVVLDDGKHIAAEDLDIQEDGRVWVERADAKSSPSKPSNAR